MISIHAACRGIVRLLLTAALVSPLSASDDRAGERAPVVLELFTSQGCSSCPPADALLRELGAEEDVVALSFHVDTWNRLGWKDPFSDVAWSRRQEEYVRAFRGDTLYTPQIVVDGVRDLVGSDRARIGQAIDERRMVGKRLRPELTVARSGEGVRASVGELAGLPRGAVDLEVFVTESGIETQVKRGENAHRTLRHDHVVRTSKRIVGWRGEAVDLSLALDSAWSHDRLEVVVLVQQSRGRRVLGADRAKLPPAPAAD